MVAVPALTLVTTPVDGLTVETEVLEDDHVPPDTPPEAVNVILLPRHILVGPLMVPAAGAPATVSG